MDSPATSNPSNDIYLFKGNETENLRLNEQFIILQKSFDRGPVTLSDSLQEGRVNKVLDIAAGSLAWTLEVAHSVEPSKVQLYACDISSDTFPPKTVLDAFSITTFIHDITEPFPEEMKAQFDVINMRLMVYAFTGEKWKLAVKNIHDILKPGGHLHLYDFDIPWHAGPEVTPDIVASWLPPLNNILLRHAKAVGYIHNLTERLPDILCAGSFVIRERLIGFVPYGVTIETFRSKNGAPLEENRTFMGPKTAKLIMNRVLAGALAGGHLDDGHGNPVTTEEERMQLLERFNKGFDTHGVLFQGTHITAVRV